jgi:hypothetical protein
MNTQTYSVNYYEGERLVLTQSKTNCYPERSDFVRLDGVLYQVALRRWDLNNFEVDVVLARVPQDFLT